MTLGKDHVQAVYVHFMFNGVTIEQIKNIAKRLLVAAARIGHPKFVGSGGGLIPAN
jgi:hypothetical protein